MRKYLFLFLLLSPWLLSGQEKTTEKIKVYLDCNMPWLCDIEFLRNELKMVDYVRDRFLCDVQVVSNVQFSAGGGELNTLSFLGQNKFDHHRDTIEYFNDPTYTEDDKRRKMLRYLKLGLVQYIAKSPIAEQVEITYKVVDGDSSATTSKVKDKWNLWQYQIGSAGFFNGDRNSSSVSVSSRLSASRETEKNRFNLSVYNEINRSRYNYFDNNEEQIIKVNTDQQGLIGDYVVKKGQHWAVGMACRANRDVFSNIDFRASLRPKIEYSITPYKDFNSKRLVVEYSIGPQYSTYRDTTIYLKVEELLLQQTIGITTSITQPWGSVNAGVEYTTYLHDLSKNNIFIGGGVSWRIFKGLQFSVGGNFSFQYDQLSIPKGNASLEDLLTKSRIIGSSYNYWGGIGFSYSFGSIYNSQVNPTFKGLNYSLNF